MPWARGVCVGGGGPGEWSLVSFVESLSWAGPAVPLREPSMGLPWPARALGGQTRGGSLGLGRGFQEFVEQVGGAKGVPGEERLEHARASAALGIVSKACVQVHE